MKKCLSVLLAIAVCFGFCATTYASSDENSSVNEPILDYTFLASSNIAEVDGNVVIIKETSNPLQGRSNISNEKRETIVLVPNENSSAEDIMNDINSFLSARSNGSKFEEASDRNLSATIYTTIYYTRKTENKRNYILLTQVEGGVSHLDGFTSVVSQFVRMGCVDAYTQSQKETKYPERLTWSYDTPTSWEYVYEDANLSIVGAFYEVELKRGSPNYTWKHELSNNIVFNFDNM